MKKLELEVKILDINESEFIKKITKMGATYVESVSQYLYTYDLPTIYGRYIDILTQLNNPESIVKYETSFSKLKLLFFYLDNLMTEKDRKLLIKIINTNNINDLLEKKNMLEYLNSKKLINFMKKYENNSKKWIRLRKTNDKTTIAVKHILANNNTNLQQMLETEIEVPGIKEANEFLESLGFSYKSYQEKRRTTYKYEGYEIDIDTWPGIPTYFEIEGGSEKELREILNKLGYNYNDSVSCSADEVYKLYGKSMFDKRELTFDTD